MKLLLIGYLALIPLQDRIEDEKAESVKKAATARKEAVRQRKAEPG